jgi:hypothetical protein
MPDCAKTAIALEFGCRMRARVSSAFEVAKIHASLADLQNPNRAGARPQFHSHSAAGADFSVQLVRADVSLH